MRDPGFHYSILSEFRTRLLENEWEQKLFDKLRMCFRDAGYLKKRGQQRTDSTLVLGAVRELNRLEMVNETLRHALDSLAIISVQTTLATTDDGKMTTPIHKTLQARDLLPADHLVDTAYLDAELNCW